MQNHISFKHNAFRTQSYAFFVTGRTTVVLRSEHSPNERNVILIDLGNRPIAVPPRTG